MIRSVGLLTGAVFSVAVGAHHSANVYFDRSDVGEETATDPGVFTEPVTVSRRWIWIRGEERIPCNCVADDSGPG